MPNDATRFPTDEAARLVASMTIEEQALLLSGDGWWRSHGIERLGLPAIGLSDGPHGLRKVAAAGLGESVPATCFPTAPALAATWNAELVREVGAALGREAQASDVQILLGPGINIKRSPLGGRNFEYFSEDPLLSGRMAAAYIDGLQREGVGASLKHYAVNSQESERMATSSDIDPRTLHEIYLRGFEIAVREAQPWTVMSAYNLVNGTYASEHRELLIDILREQWGFDGFVVSDWGAINDRVRGVEAGTNLEMPGSGSYNRAKIIRAVHDGRLSKEALAQSATELVAVVLKAAAARRPGARFDADAHHALARRVGAEAIVLLKNDGGLLPIAAGQRVALIGAFARTPRYQGAGSSQVNPTRVSNVHDELVALLGAERVVHAEGCDVDGGCSDAQLAEAARQAAAADLAIVFAGLPDSYESEGFDRRSIDLPEGHLRLIDAVARAQPKLVVALMNGSAVAMPWAARVPAIVEAWLGGQAGGGALADVLSGRVNPSGKLAETFPVDLEQTPAFPHFPGRAGHALYGEGLFVGYRHYDKRRLQPLYPFGYGLSYTRFEYRAIGSSAPDYDADGTQPLTIDVSVKNIGSVAGQEVVQLYLRACEPAVVRAETELRGFAKVALAPGEQASVRFALQPHDFARYDAEARAWVVDAGRYELLAGGSSRDLPLAVSIDVRAGRAPAAPLSRRSLVGDLKRHPDGPAVYGELVHAIGFGELSQPLVLDGSETPAEAAAKRKTREAVRAFVDEMPIVKVPAFSLGAVSDARIEELLARAGSGQ